MILVEALELPLGKRLLDIILVLPLIWTTPIFAVVKSHHGIILLP